MGYRSDVAYTIRFNSDHDENNKQSFFTFLAEAKAKAATAACFLEREWVEFVVDEARFRINFAVDGVKWYESYEDVKCHEALLDLAAEWANDEDNNSGIGFMFVRVGEENDDVEQRYGGEYDHGWLDVHRSISRDW
jgi:hypothetical protein